MDPEIRVVNRLIRRIDNPKTGWKGKGLWSTYATRVMFHVQGGKGTTGNVLHFQLRPIRWRIEGEAQVQ